MHRLDSMDEGSLHPDILSDNIHDALGNPGCCNWAAEIQKQFASLGVPSPFSGGRIRNVDHHAFRKAMLARDMSVCPPPPPHGMQHLIDGMHHVCLSMALTIQTISPTTTKVIVLHGGGGGGGNSLRPYSQQRPMRTNLS